VKKGNFWRCHLIQSRRTA